VIINLVINAQQAMQEQEAERMLTVRTFASPVAGEVVLEIADSGPGVPGDLRGRIFEPFFTTKPQEVGTGVGLSFSQGLVEAHGGRLELAEAESGRGAMFRITLPMGVAEEPIVTPVAVIAAARRDRTALVVDDEPQIARGLAEFLELEGYACDTAFGGAEAKLRLAAVDYDLIVSDLRMPDVDGPSLFAWIKAEKPALARRVAFATGDTLGAPAVRFLAREGRPFMEKPFTPESLRTLLDDLQACA
jgi:CheY-like chemotaxis protein